MILFYIQYKNILYLLYINYYEIIYSIMYYIFLL